MDTEGALPWARLEDLSVHVVRFAVMKHEYELSHNQALIGLFGVVLLWEQASAVTFFAEKVTSMQEWDLPSVQMVRLLPFIGQKECLPPWDLAQAWHI